VLTLRKAIETLERDLEDKVMPHKAGVREAEQLGKEAMVRLSNMRINPNEDAGRLLPGEET